MGVRKIVWSRRALVNYTEVILWYRKERGKQFADKFYLGILDTVNTLAQMPAIGTVDSRFSNSRTVYYSFLLHPKYRIVYRYTKTTLYIVAIRATMKEE